MLPDPTLMVESRGHGRSLNAPTGAWCSLTGVEGYVAKDTLGLNAPTGAWCSLTFGRASATDDAKKSQCTYRCVVLPDGTTLHYIGTPDTSQCTYRCVVLPD